MALQLVPLPVGLLGALSPARAELAGAVAEVTEAGVGADSRLRPSGASAGQAVGDGLENIGHGVASHTEGASHTPWTPISIHPEATALALAQIVTLAAVFAMIAGRRRTSATEWPPTRGIGHGADSHTLLQVLVLVASVQAGLAVVQYAARLAGSSAWLPIGLGGLTGTYVNKNGAGDLIAMALPVTAAILVGRIMEWRGAWGVERGGAWEGSSTPIRRLVSALVGRGGIVGPAFALTVQALGVALTMSRGAMAAGAAGLGILLLAGALRWRGRAAAAAAAGVPLILALLIGAWLGLDLLLASWANLPEQHAGRVDWWVAAWNAFRANPAAGTGLGSFADAFLVHRTGDQPGFHVAHAHNDYAEALAVMGIPGGLLVALALGLLATGVVRAARRGDWLALGAGAGCAAFALHAFVDFPTAFPANAMWAVALWGLMARRVGADSRLRPSGASAGQAVGDGLETIGHGVASHIRVGADSVGDGSRGIGRGLSAEAVAKAEAASHTVRRIALALAAGAAAAPPILFAAAEPGMEAVRQACREVRRSGTLPPGVAEAWRVEREEFERGGRSATEWPPTREKSATAKPAEALAASAEGRRREWPPTPRTRRKSAAEPPPTQVEDLVARAEVAAEGWSFQSGEAWRALGTLQRFRAARVDEAGRPVLGEAERAHVRRRSLIAFADALRLRPAVGEAWLEKAGALVDDAEAEIGRGPPSRREGLLRFGGSAEAAPASAGAEADLSRRSAPPSLDELRRASFGAKAEAASHTGVASHTASNAMRRAAEAAGRAGRLAPASVRVAVREAELWLRMGRRAPGEGGPGPGARDCRERAQAAYGRALGLGPVGGATALHLRDAWQRGGSTGFMTGCIPRGSGDRTEALFRQAAALVASAAPVTEADGVLLEWRRWREEVGHSSREIGLKEASHAQDIGLKEASHTGVASHTVVLRIAGRTFGTEREETLAFEAGGEVGLSIDGLTRYRQPSGMAGNWAFNPCVRMEALVDGATAAEAFLPLDPETAAREGRPWAGLAAPPIRVRLRLQPGAHRLTLRFESIEDVTGGGRPSGMQEAEIRELTIEME